MVLTEVISDVVTERTMLKRRAVQKPSVWNPSTSLSARRMISALITSRNIPSVIMVIGSVSNTSKGFINVLRMARTMAIHSARTTLRMFVLEAMVVAEA